MLLYFLCFYASTLLCSYTFNTSIEELLKCLKAQANFPHSTVAVWATLAKNLAWVRRPTYSDVYFFTCRWLITSPQRTEKSS